MMGQHADNNQLVKIGLRRKWQATVKNRPEPEKVIASVASDEDRWQEEWKKFWPDIGLTSIAVILRHNLEPAGLYS